VGEAPALTVSSVTCRPGSSAVQHPGDAVRWQTTWVVHNAGPEPLALEAAWIPHGRFRGDGRLPLSAAISSGTAQELEFVVTADEPPGTVVENAFLILRVNVHGMPWRIFIRMRIEFDSSSVPSPVVEVVSTQSLE
jgi:hypothetical protein